MNAKQWLATALLACFSLLALRASAAPPPETWAYVAKRGRPDQVKLRTGFKTCTGDKETIAKSDVQPVDVYRTSGDKAAQCAPAEALKVSVVFGDGALRAADVKEFALDWRPQAPQQLDVYLDLKTAVDQNVLSHTKLRLEGTTIDATLVLPPVPGVGMPIYRFTGLPLEVAQAGGQLQLLPTAPALVYDGETGEDWSESLGPSSNWLLLGSPRKLQFLTPQDPGDDDVGSTLASHPLDRFVELQPIKCGSDDSVCSVSRTPTGLLIETQPPTLKKLLSKIDLSTPNVNVMQALSGHLAKTKLSVRLGVIDCAYSLSQLTRVEAGRTRVQVMYAVKRERGTAGDCTASTWDVVAKKPGDDQAVATGSAVVANDIATVTWQALPAVTPNAQATYELQLKYPGGHAVATKTTPKLAVEPAINPILNLRALASFRPASRPAPAVPWIDVAPRKALAVERENIVELADLKQRARWQLSKIGSISRFGECSAATVAANATAPTTQICVKPARPTADVLQLRATETAAAQACLLPGVAVASLGGVASTNLDLGTIEFSTELSVKPYRIAQPLDEYVKVVCGSRVIDARSLGQPTSVGFKDFDRCELVLEPPPDISLADFVDLHGSQKLEVTAGLVPTDKSAPKLQSLGKVVIDASRLRPCPASGGRQQCFSTPLALRSAAGGEVGDHAIVQVEVKHVADFYEATAERSKPESQLVVRIRRRPEWLTWSNGKGVGARTFFTFTLAPFTLFRTPHSGRKVWKSSDVGKLEAANFGAGFLGVVEPWNFDRNAPLTPFLAPQLHAGVLSTVPTSTSLSYPTVSLVFGGGVRTGVDTAPDATVESALKFLIWGEYLMTFDGRREESSLNLLLGFGVDVGSFGN